MLLLINTTLQDGSTEEKQTFDSKMYMTDKTHEDLLNMVNDLRMGDLKHDDVVIAEWIKVSRFIVIH